MRTKPPFIESNGIRLFLISFLILYLELVAIRYIPSQIRYVGYFSNVILLASFLGIGIGTIFWKKIRFPNFLFPVIIFFFGFIIGALRYDLVVSSDQVIYFNSGFNKISSEPVFLLPFIFFIVASIFILPSKILGSLFGKFPPLKAYAINIAGSIAGIIFFSITSALRQGPSFWLPSIFIISILLIKKPPIRNWKVIYGILFLAVLIFEVIANKVPRYPNSDVEYGRIYWSPYHKVSLYQQIEPDKKEDEEIIRVSVNNIGHQTILSQNLIESINFYQYPYKIYPNRIFKKVLVIGAGTGNDVAMALNRGAERVVAVEIDPIIYNLGEQFHPEAPYSSEKVEIVVDDGRAYLVKSQEKFDLIIFALTDSLTLTSAASNLRLESYLFTKEAFADAKDHLDQDGLFVLYNYYRRPWLVDKIGTLLEDTFSRKPYIVSSTTELGPSSVLVAAKKAELPKTEYIIHDSNLSLPTDDWPFLYLKKRSIPLFYLKYLGVIIGLTSIVLFTFLKRSKTKFNWPLFHMGVAFMLLETKNVVQFSLLFGSTWITNSLVFSGILTLVLLAVIIAGRINIVKINRLYVLLFAMIAISYLFPQRELLKLASMPRFVGATLINFSPIFVANLIFAVLFKKSKITHLAYGSNIVGSFTGGILEYSSMILGYRNLTLFVAFFYAMSLVTAKKLLRR
jgi:spermidine synthase